MVTIREPRDGEVVEHELTYNDLISAHDMRFMKEVEDKDGPGLREIALSESAQEYFQVIFKESVKAINFGRCAFTDLVRVYTDFFSSVLTPSNT